MSPRLMVTPWAWPAASSSSGVIGSPISQKVSHTAQADDVEQHPA